MKRRSILPIVFILILLTGCSGKQSQTKFKEFQTRIAASQYISFTADIRAEYDDSVQEYTLDFVKENGESAVKITAPEMLAGITARISAEDDAKIEFEGASLAAGPLPGGLTPVSALPALVLAMQQGHLDMAWQEKDATVATLTLKDDQTMTVWFDENMTPYHAELQSTGKVVVFCDIINFNLT